MSIAGSRFSYHRDALALRRIHSGNMSSSTGEMHRFVLDIIERHLAAISLSAADQRSVDQRLRRTRGDLHVERAKNALGGDDLGRVRDELWKAVRCEITPKRLLGAAALTLFPKAAARILRARYSHRGRQG
jgi:hypothetical protein